MPAPACLGTAGTHAATGTPTGPLCLGCNRVVDMSSEDHAVVEVAARSIYAPTGCLHRPYCSSCAGRLRRQTLPVCLGCGALVSVIAPGPNPGTDPGPRTSEPTAAAAAAPMRNWLLCRGSWQPTPAAAPSTTEGMGSEGAGGTAGTLGHSPGARAGADPGADTHAGASTPRRLSGTGTN